MFKKNRKTAFQRVQARIKDSLKELEELEVADHDQMEKNNEEIRRKEQENEDLRVHKAQASRLRASLAPVMDENEDSSG